MVSSDYCSCAHIFGVSRSSMLQIISTYGLLSSTNIRPLGATMFAPGVKQAMENLHSENDYFAPLAVSIYVLGWGLAPLVVAPLSEVQGRSIVYTTCNILFICFTIACAMSPNAVTLIVFRFLEGAVSSAPLAIGGGTISDVIAVEKRGLALSLFMLGPVLGPSIGPALGGYITSTLGWAWIFWMLAIAVCFNFFKPAM